MSEMYCDESPKKTVKPTKNDESESDEEELPPPKSSKKK
jgi:hypothetical protein